MESESSQPGTPAGGPLRAVTQERVNQQRDSSTSVHDKISQFNNLSIAMQTKQLERKTADAALKRAMLGREEAEVELRKHKEELRALRKAVEEGKERERRVGERLETVMENYGRAKETHAHTQTLWEKEIRRARKETFKTQSTNVKLQEELKTTRTAVKILEESLGREKERSRVREQEAFEARYQIVGVQEQLDNALARIKVVEQERDAFKTAAKNEEVARIAAEGRIPLPQAQNPNDEFASPPKKSQKKRKISSRPDPRYSLSTMEIESSVATELEIEELNDRVQWEKQRADRAAERIEFLEAECQMKCCPCGRSKSRPLATHGASPRHTKQSPPRSVEVAVVQEVDVPANEPVEESAMEAVEEVVEEAILEPVEEPAMERLAEPVEAHVEEHVEDHLVEPVRRHVEEPVMEPPMEAVLEHVVVPEESPQHQEEEMRDIVSPPRPELQPETDLAPPRSKKGPRLSTIFCPKEGIFRTVSEQEAEALEAQKEAEVIIADVPEAEDLEAPRPVEQEYEPEPEPEHEFGKNLRMYARTPSVDPPTFALLGQQRVSLMSLLNAPHNYAHEAPVARVPMVPDLADSHHHGNGEEHPVENGVREPSYEFEPRESLEPRPHTSATLYTTVTTTVPVRDENFQRESSSSLNEKLRTPSHSSDASFDITNPALTPTMTREEALAKIRERRGRARSAANGTATPHKKMLQGKDRREMSAPTARTGGKLRS